MAVTLVCDPIAEEDYSVGNLASRRFKIVTGSFDYGATCGGGVSMDIPLNRVMGCVVMPANGYVFAYDAGTLKAYEVGKMDIAGSGSAITNAASVMLQAVTGTAMATCSALNFFAWGYE